MKPIKIVERLLSRGNYAYTPQQLRDSDKKLLLAYWDIEGFRLSENQKRTFLDKCTPAESITRARRKLKHLYPASPKVDQARYEQFKKFKGEGIETIETTPQPTDNRLF